VRGDVVICKISGFFVSTILILVKALTTFYSYHPRSLGMKDLNQLDCGIRQFSRIHGFGLAIWLVGKVTRWLCSWGISPKISSYIISFWRKHGKNATHCWDLGFLIVSSAMHDKMI
jgi:hypothetical protein